VDGGGDVGVFGYIVPGVAEAMDIGLREPILEIVEVQIGEHGIG
jgi:hypothetical protein